MPLPSRGGPRPEPAPGLLGKRRDFLVSRRFQLRATLLTAAAVLVLLVFLNVALYLASSTSTESLLDEAPFLAETLRARDRLQLWLVLAASAVFLAGVVVIGILETHRTAGAEISLIRRLGEVEQGRFGTRVVLRRGDNLGRLADAFNTMSERLRQDATSDAATLERLADRAEATVHDPAREPVAQALRRMARAKREKLAPPGELAPRGGAAEEQGADPSP